MYELLTLQPAFTGRDRQQLLRQILDEELRPLRRLNDAIPADLETIVLKAMAKEARVRYDTAQELSDDLRRFLQDKPIKARRPTLAQRAVKWSRRHRSVVGAAVVVLVMAVVALSISTVMIWREQVKTQRALTQSALNFQKAREAVDEVTRISEEQLGNAPRMEHVRHELLQKAQIFYEGFLEENSQDPEVRQETGEAYKRVGGIHIILGQYEQSQQAYLKAIDIFEKLASDYPNSGDYREEIVINLNKLANVLGILALHQEAIQACLQAVAVAEKLVTDFSDVPQYRSDLAGAHIALGNVLVPRPYNKVR